MTTVETLLGAADTLGLVWAVCLLFTIPRRPRRHVWGELHSADISNAMRRRGRQ